MDQELYSFGLKTSPILDGNIHRFDGVKSLSGWYIGSEHEKFGKIITVGDWVTNEKKVIKDSVTNSREVKRILQDQIQKAQKEKETRQKTSADICKTHWEKASENLFHPYLTKKGLKGSFGARVLGECLFVPCFDTERKLWGFQTIEEGVKRFYPGQKVQGTFHTIGALENGGKAYICEGFATGASIHLASGLPVVCAFSAGNIKPVSLELAKKYPKTEFIICGDDDVYGKENRGRKDATEASSKLGSTPIFPNFKSINTKPTDFNDLHLLDGLSEVTKQLKEGTKAQKKSFVALGFDGSMHYWFLERTRTIYAMPPYQEEKLFMLMSHQQIKDFYGDGEGKLDWGYVKSKLIEQQLQAGPFKPSKIRGQGVWQDKKQYVYNRNEEIICEDKSSLSFHYVSSSRDMPPLTLASPEDFQKVIEALDVINFANPSDKKLLGGWLMIARVASALDVRPHLWLTGPSGCGKSTIFSSIIQPLLGSGGTRVDMGTSAAGIRQEVGKDGAAIVFDEFETGERIGDFRKIHELIRVSWRKGGSLKKGTPGGSSIEYPCNSPFILGSVRVHFETSADENRFSVVEILPPTGFLAAEKLIPITELLGDRIFSSAFFGIARIQENARVLRLALNKAGLDNRRSDQIGTLLAGWVELSQLTKDILSAEEAYTVAADFLSTSSELEEAKDPEKDDANQCLQHLLGS